MLMLRNTSRLIVRIAIPIAVLLTNSVPVLASTTEQPPALHQLTNNPVCSLQNGHLIADDV